MTNSVGAASIELSVDSSGVETGLQRAEGAVARTGRSLQTLGQQGSAALDNLGSGSGQAAGRVDAATRSLIGSIQRTTAAMEAGSRGSRQYFEALANQRGVNADALRPYLDQLEAVNQGQRSVGVSAGQTAAALRQVPAQVTDIVTSLQAGQAPLTVFLQQGGQLRDSFGSTGAAARALGGYIVGLVNPLTIAAATAGVLAVAYNQGSKEADAYNRALILTGNAAGTTAGQLADMARNISQSVGTQGQAAEAIAALASTGQVAAANLERFADVALRANKAIGVSVQDTAKDFAELGKSPLQATERLNEQYHFLTAAVYEQIKALEEQGRKDEAADLAQKTYAEAMGQRSKAITSNLGTIERAWASTTDVAKKAWDAMLNIGREDTLQQKLDGVQERIKTTQRKLYSFIDAPDAKRNLVGLREEEAALKAQIANQNKANDEKAAANKLEAARIDWLKEGEKYQSRQEQLETEITKARVTGAAAGKSQADIEARIGEIRKKYSDIFNDGVDSQIEALKRRSTIEEEVQKRSQAMLNTAHSAGLVNDKDYIEANAQIELAALAKKKEALQQELALTATKQNSLKDQAALRGQIAQVDAQAASRQIELEDELFGLEVKRTRAAADAYANLIDQEQGKRDALKQQLTTQKDYNEQIGLNAQGVTDLAAARLEDQAATLEQNATLAETVDLTGVLSATYREQAKLLRDLASAKREGAMKEAGVEAAKQTEQAWKRTADQIESSLTDALMRGFESGKGFLRNLLDTGVNMFKTTVLRPTIQGVVTGSVGGGSAPVSALQTASGLGNLYNTFAGVGGTVTGIGNLVGSGYISAIGTGLSQGAAAGEAIAAYEAAAAADSAGAGAVASGLSLGSSISTAIAAIPGWGWAAMGAAALIGMSGIFGDGPEKDTHLTFASNNQAGNISINERGNEGKWDQSYIDGHGTGAFGTFGVSRSFWMSSQQDAVQGFINTVTQVDNALAGFLTDTEKASVTTAVSSNSFIAHTGEEGANPNATGQLDEVFKQRLNVIFEGIAPGLSSLLENFKGSSPELASEAAAILDFRKALGDSGAAIFGATVSLQELAQLKGSTESTSAALSRVALEFRTTNAVIEALGVSTSTAFGAVGLASEEARKRLIDLAGGADALASQSQFFAQNFLSKAEQIEPVQRELNKRLEELGYAGLTTAADYKAAVLQLAQSGALATDAGTKTYAALLALAPTFKTVADYLAETKESASSAADALAEAQSKIDGVTDALKTGVNAALDQLQQSVSAEKDAATATHEQQAAALQAQIDSASGALGKLQSLSQSLRGALSGMQAPGAERADRLAAQAELQAALAKARAGGGLPDADKFKDVLAVLSRDASKQFSSFDEYQRDYYKTAGDIAALADLTDGQVSVQQQMLDSLQEQKTSLEQAYKKQLERLDQIANSAKSQLDQLLGINQGVQSLNAAMAGFAAALAAVKGGASQSNPGQTNFTVTDLYKTVLGRDPDAAGLEFWTNAFGASVDNAEIADFIKGAQPELDAKGSGSWADWLRAHGVPGFATGGDHLGGLRLVGENGPELEVTGPSRIFNAQQTQALLRSDNGEVAAQLAALGRLIERLQKVMENVEGGTGKTAELLQRISTNGGPLMVTNGARPLLVQLAG
jgi:phage-related minor tail protein